jgi:hypothetical protein
MVTHIIYIIIIILVVLMKDTEAFGSKNCMKILTIKGKVNVKDLMRKLMG